MLRRQRVRSDSNHKEIKLASPKRPTLRSTAKAPKSISKTRKENQLNKSYEYLPNVKRSQSKGPIKLRS